MPDMTNKNRVQAGVPTGGEFAARNRTESPIALKVRSQPGEYIAQSSSSGLCWHGSDEDINVATGFTDEDFGTIANHYLVAALWSTSTMDDDEGEFLDDNHDISDISDSAREKTQADLAKFLTDNREHIEAARETNYGMASGDASGFLGQVGHDFLLTRNGTGTGFWDRQELSAGGLGERLSDAARAFGSAEFYIGDDGKIYL